MHTLILRRHKASYTVMGALMLMSLSGCATDEKCGAAGCAGDGKITASVRAQFDKRPDLQGIDEIQVQTLNHVVYLSGQVSEGLQSEIAESIARQTKGVTRVENAISVTK